MLRILILVRNGKMVGLKEGARVHQALEEHQGQGRKKRGIQALAVEHYSRYPIRDELGHTMKLGKLTDV
jgi:hypothetical protein